MSADEPARRAKQRGCVQATGLVEQALYSSKLVWKSENRRCRDERPVVDWGALHVDHVQRCFAADAAAGRGVEVVLCFQFEYSNDRDADHVVVLLFAGNAAIADAPDISLGGDQALGKEEADRECEVIAGCAHGDGDVALLRSGLIDSDLQRLFRREVVTAAAARSLFDPDDLDPGRATRSFDLDAVARLGGEIGRASCRE